MTQAAQDPGTPAFVGIGQSEAEGALQAVREAVGQIDGTRACFVLAFIPARLAVPEVMDAIDTALPGVPVFGCTTAGQITRSGYDDDSLLLMAFPRKNFRCSSLLFSELGPDKVTDFAALALRQNETFQHTAGWNRMALIFTDGLSKQEDLLVSTLETVLDGLPIFGGSAGDALRFEQTLVLHKGRAHSNAAVLLLIETNLSFQGVGFHHFLPVGAPVVITDADPDERLVFEINGAPAAEEYARLVGCPVEALSPEVFAEHPVLLSHGSDHYVRAIGDTKDGQALSFLAAIDDGLILTLGEARESTRALLEGLDLADAQGRRPDFILGFDCFLRKLEFEQKQLKSEVSDILRAHRVFGFNTYGEQEAGLHMNQTFVGVAFFGPQKRALN